MYRVLLLLLIIASCKQARKTSEIPSASADSLIQLMRTNLADHFHHRRIDNILGYLDSIQPTVETRNQPALTGAWLAYRGAAYVFSDMPDSSRFYMNRALEVAAKDTSRKALLIPKIQMVTFLIQQKSYDTALKHGLEAYELAKLNAPPELPILYAQLAFLYKQAGDNQSRRKFLFEGLGIAKQPQHIAILSSDIGRYYSESGHGDSAIYFYKHFLSFNKYSNTFIDAWKHDDLGSLLLELNRPKEAIDNMLEAVRLYKQNGRTNEKIYFNLGAAYHQLRLHEKGDQYLDTALDAAARHSNLALISTIFSKKAKIEKDRARYALAYQFLDSSYHYYTQNDSLAFFEKARTIESKISRKAKDDQIAALAFEMKASKRIIKQRQFIIIVLIIAALLGIGFGVMLFRRRELKVQLREFELQQESEGRQMQPHFVFNSLGVLQSFIRNDHPGKAIKYLSMFAKLIRMNFENSRQSFVPLQDEITALTSYLLLQEMDNENLFEYQMAVYDAEDEVFIPPMLLQPFVENSILHGFANLGHKGKINISIKKNGHSLHCEIEDNGTGLDSKAGEMKRSYATSITKARLDLLTMQTGHEAKVTIVDKQTAGEGQGVKVILEIPFMLSQRATYKSVN